MTTPEVERLISRLKDKDAGIRRSAAEALGKVGLDAKGAVGALARALKDDDKNVVFDAAFALGRIGGASVPALIDTLKESDKSVRRRAIEALRMIGHEAVAALKEVDPHDAKKIMELQNMIRWADAFPDFIRDMVQIGRNAEEQIKLGDINE